MPEVNGVSGERLKQFIDAIERLEEEKSVIAEQIKDKYSEAKAVGFDTKTIRKLIALRKLDAEKRKEQNELLDIYANAIQLDLF